MDHLDRLGSKFPFYLQRNMILNSLPKSYDTFIMNYNMNGWEKPISELHQMLKTVENNIPKKPTHVLMVRKGHIKKSNWKNSKGKTFVAKGKERGKKFLKPKSLKKGESDEKKTRALSVLL